MSKRTLRSMMGRPFRQPSLVGTGNGFTTTVKIPDDPTFDSITVNNDAIINGVIEQEGEGVNNLKETYVNTLLGADYFDTITQKDADIISQTGTGVNVLKSTAINGTLSATSTGTINQTSGSVITQSGFGVNMLRSTNFDGLVSFNGGTITSNTDLVVTAPSKVFASFADINQSGSYRIVQTGTGTNSLKSVNVAGKIDATEFGVITQATTVNNTLSHLAVNGSLSVSANATTSNITSSGKISASSFGAITQSGNITNTLKKTDLTELIADSIITDYITPKALIFNTKFYSGTSVVITDTTSMVVVTGSGSKSLTMGSGIFPKGHFLIIKKTGGFVINNASDHTFQDGNGSTLGTAILEGSIRVRMFICIDAANNSSTWLSVLSL